MTQETNITPVNGVIPGPEVKEETKVEVTSNIETLVSDRVNAELAKIKSSLDNAYAERDAAKAEITKIAKEKQSQEIKSLEAAGKHSEVLKIEMNEIKQELDLYRKRNTELSRDNVVKSQLSGLEFRNEKAAIFAHGDIIKSLRQDSTGNWMHESGVSVTEAIASYAKADVNAFMFNVKANVGTGTVVAKPATGNAPTKAAKDMSQDELLNALETGKVAKPAGIWTE